MQKEITQEQIISYIYKETNEIDSKIIAEAIIKDRAIKLFYLETLNTVKLLDAEGRDASITSINIILDEVQKSNLKTPNPSL